MVFKADQQFRAVDGEIVQQGIYRKVPCTVTGVDRTIPLIAGIPTTTDSSDPSATWTTYFEDSGHSRKDDWLSGFQLNHVNTSPVPWSTIFDDNNPQGINVPSGGVSFDQMVLYVNGRIAQISGDTIATGIGTIALGGLSTTVLDSHVAVDSPIEAIARGGSDITGRLHATNYVAGVSFDVYSDNPADSGNFQWIIRP